MNSIDPFLEERRKRDTLSIFTVDVKKGSDGKLNILEFGEPGCFRSSKMVDNSIAALSTKKFNPLQKKVIFIDRAVVRPERGLVQVVKGDSQFKPLEFIRSPSWENYSQIIVNNNRSKCVFNFQDNTFHCNDPFFTPFSEGKFLSLYLAQSFAPKTVWIPQPIKEDLNELLGRPVVLKSVYGALGRGIRYLLNLTPETLEKELKNFDISGEIENWSTFSEEEKRFARNCYFPNIIQEMVPDEPIKSEKGKGVSVDRVEVLVKSQLGKVEVEYLGGIHRFRKPGVPINKPWCIQGGTAEMEELSLSQNEEMKKFLDVAVKTTYLRALGLPLDFYENGTDVVNDKKVRLSEYRII